MQLSIPVASGVEASVKRQLRSMGYGECPALQGRIALEGDWQDVARLNVSLRSGERVLLVLAQFCAPDFDTLFENVSKIAWEEFFTPHTKILMDGKCRESALMAVKVTGGVIKKAIVERLRAKLGVQTLDERGERAVVNFDVFENLATIALDTSGDGLHKRGYRVLSYEAPLRETTAAALVESSFFHAGKPFADVFCGSGTIPIEAALYMRRIAPGINRHFDFEKWKCVPGGSLGRAREEARDREVKEKLPLLSASDISPRAVETALYHAKRAGVDGDIDFRVQDMRKFSSSQRYGVLISNPPYGERMKGDMFTLYRDFGKMFRALPDWSCVFLSSYADAARAFGGNVTKRRHIGNAKIACTLYTYAGKRPNVTHCNPM